MNTSPQIIFGFDFGLKHIGVATGQMITRTATSLGVLSAIHGEPTWKLLDRWVEEWRPIQFVVGLPLNMDSTEQFITQKAKVFCEQLKDRYQLPTSMMDERLSTREARSLLFEEGGYKALKKSAIDALSAKLILETWLKYSV